MTAVLAEPDLETITSGVVERIRVDAQFAALVAEQLGVTGGTALRTIAELIDNDEDFAVEFKSTARWDLRGNKPNKAMEDAVVKTVAGFLNSDGGTLLIGVGPDRTIVGLDHDYAVARPPNGDGFVNWLTTHLTHALGHAAVMRTRARIAVHADHEICRLDVARSPKPVWAKTSKGEQVFREMAQGATSAFGGSARICSRATESMSSAYATMMSVLYPPSDSPSSVHDTLPGQAANDRARDLGHRGQHPAILIGVLLGQQRPSAATPAVHVEADPSARSAEPPSTAGVGGRYLADSGYGQDYYVDREPHPRRGGYVARCLELGVTSEGDTVEEAVAMLREAVELYLEDEPLPSNLTHPVLVNCSQRVCGYALHYLSMSPTTKNMEPRIAIMSASRLPRMSSGSTWTLLNDAERSFIRHGVFSPRETR